MAIAAIVVMAGGSGTRFWPKSTSRRPKQLLSFGRDPRCATGRIVAVQKGDEVNSFKIIKEN